MANDAQKLQKAYDYIRSITNFQPRAAIVLGSGLGDFAGSIECTLEIPYQEIPGFPVSTVAGHAGKYIFGFLHGMPVVAMQGRVHYYEGYDIKDVVLPVRLMGKLGAEVLLLTNAAGGIREDFSAGALMLLRDHISLFAPSPLVGYEDGTVHFVDMTEAYDKKLRCLMQKAAVQLGIPLKEGVYAQVTGPQYETPQEIRMLRTLGADAVGMSTACETIAARHAGMRVCAVSCITNMAAGIEQKKLSHEEVQECARRVGGDFGRLLNAFFAELQHE